MTTPAISPETVSAGINKAVSELASPGAAAAKAKSNQQALIIIGGLVCVGLYLYVQHRKSQNQPTAAV